MEKLFIYNCCAYEPTLICDYCSESFASYAEAIAAYKMQTTDVGVLSIEERSQITSRGVCPEQHNVVHLHKKCVDAYDNKFGTHGWHPLLEFYSRMLHPLGLQLVPLEIYKQSKLAHQS